MVFIGRYYNDIQYDKVKCGKGNQHIVIYRIEVEQQHEQHQDSGPGKDEKKAFDHDDDRILGPIEFGKVGFVNSKEPKRDNQHANCQILAVVSEIILKIPAYKLKGTDKCKHGHYRNDNTEYAAT